MASPSEPPPAPLEVPPWLKTLPVAPEYHPTAAEFQDPIAYILKIEKEAAAYGICKIVPPLPAPPKKTAVANLNRSFAARDPNPKKPPTFTTRQQQIGFCPRRPRPVQKPVWQSGEHYTLQQFEAKAKQFERAHIKRAVGSRKSSAGGAAAPLSPLEVETLFWKASADKPFSVEYANDMPGSGFAPLTQGRRWRGEEEAANVGETAWNMRGVSRAKGSLLRFMKEEIPGVTSPMVYVAMMFSWFAWHVEDHELHSLNYLHMGSGKTWYGVPRDAGLAFEEVVRMHGYGGEVNPLMTFAILGEKTTVMSPEVLVGAGIPCCRLVQNAGEFVVTFPGAYHSGFSLGFNCGEAANIATPGWLSFAKEAAIRRASINYPPMVSHFQLLYSLALSLTRAPVGGGSEPRSSRLKDKMKGEGEEMIKKSFAQNVIQNNHLLNFLLGKGLSCIVLPQNATESPLCPNSLVRAQIKVKPRLSLGLCSQQEALEASRGLPSNDVVLGWNPGIKGLNGLFQLKGSTSLGSGKALQSETSSKTSSADFCSSSSDSQNIESEKQGTFQGDGLLDQGLLSCVTCGILSFSCVAVIQPTERATKYLMSAECGFLTEIGLQDSDQKISDSEHVEGDTEDRRNGNLVHCRMYSAQVSEQPSAISDFSCPKSSALDLLASAYGDSSDVEEDVLHEKSTCIAETDMKETTLFCNGNQLLSAVKPENFQANQLSQDEMHLQSAATDGQNATSQKSQSAKVPDGSYECLEGIVHDRNQLKPEMSSSLNKPINEKFGEAHCSFKDSMEMTTSSTSNRITEELKDFDAKELDDHSQNIGTAAFHQSPLISEHASVSVDKPINYDSYCKSVTYTRNAELTPEIKDIDRKVMNSTLSVMQRTDKDSSRMHVFCLEHAAEVEKLLQPIGGVHMMLLCHPDYPKIEAEAKVLAKELGICYTWRNIHFRDADSEDEERIRQALEDEEVMPMNNDWSVKLGINMYYTANLSKSPLYSKQMPYNSIIYRVFGHSSPGSSPNIPRAPGRRLGRQRKIIVAGRWCGRVWMSNQVHPYLNYKSEVQEEEHMETLYNDIDESPFEIDTTYSSQVTPSSRKSLGNMSDKSCRRKRKMPLRKSISKKSKTSEVDCTPKSEDLIENSASSCRRLLRSSRVNYKDSTVKNKLNVKDEAGGPSSRLRKRPSKSEELITKSAKSKQTNKKKTKKTQATNIAVKDEGEEHTCDLEGCSMSFSSKHDLTLHKRDICPVKGCGKKFFSHKYLVQHRKVHMDDRPLVCPWKGCKMTFKWAWARTEHIRVHTGDRPYICHEPGCGQTFRFVSDFSRHKRKTGHSIKKSRRY